jgi:hypothetical protein
MKKSAISHHKTHKPLRWRDSRRATVGVPPPGLRRGADLAETPGSHWRGHRFRFSLPGALNWTLRRYVRASSLRVWLIRRVTGTGRASGLADRNGPLCARGRQARAVCRARSPMLRERAIGVSRPEGSALRYRASRNRQMEHLVQVAAVLRGGVRRGSAITPRERSAPWDLGLATLSSKTCVESNIFGFVMT